jgi:para-nitrobenzyl esterase
LTFENNSRRGFIAQTAGLLLATSVARAQASADAIAKTTSGRVRGVVVNGIRVFKGIPYGASTAGKNRFMPPVKPDAWTGVRDALAYGPTAPQVVARSNPASMIPGIPSANMSEDCLVLNVFTPSLDRPANRPVMVWLHGGGFVNGAGSEEWYEGSNLARRGDVVVVSVNHRLNALGFTYLPEQAGSDFALSGGVGMLDLVAALRWVRENIAEFGGNPNLVTVFGESGGGRKVSILMAMPSAQGLFHRAIVESGAVLRLLKPDTAIQQTELLLKELGIKPGEARALQNVPVEKLVAANAVVLAKMNTPEPGYSASSPVVDGKAMPSNPWDPAAPAISAKIPLMIGWNHTEETLFDRPTPEKLALTPDGLVERARKRLDREPGDVIDAYRKAHPDVSPWDLYILIATDHPRGSYARELAKRKAALKAAPAYLYRFDYETTLGGGHMRSPHTIEIPFVFNNLALAPHLVEKNAETQALADRVSDAWVAFARKGNPNTAGLPKWPEYSASARDTMLFNVTSRAEKDPDRGPREAMARVLGLS